MEKSSGLTLVFNYKQTNTYAIHVIVGALETALDSEHFRVTFSRTPEGIVSAVKEALDRDNKVIVAWSFHSPQFIETLAELKLIKSQVNDPRVIHLAGGVHATAEPEETLQVGFDFVAIGEGEKTIIDFITRILNGEDYFHTRGIVYHDNGRSVSNGLGERIDLNDYPPFATKHRKFNPIEITRGCIYACKFCQTPFMFKARFRHRTVENICYYVQVMKDHGLTDIRFITPNSLSYGSSDSPVNLDKIEELLASIRKVLRDKGRIFFGTFPSEVRPEHVTREALLLLRKYVSNNNIIIGAQSGSQRILDICRRGHTVDDIISAVKISLEIGFIPNVDLIFGLPGERASDMKSTLKLAEQLSDMGARLHGHTFMPLPGTPFKNAPAGMIWKGTMRKLKRLESRGKLYGQWKPQITIAEGLTTITKHQGKAHETEAVNVSHYDNSPAR